MRKAFRMLLGLLFPRIRRLLIPGCFRCPSQVGLLDCPGLCLEGLNIHLHCTEERRCLPVTYSLYLDHLVWLLTYFIEGTLVCMRATSGPLGQLYKLHALSYLSKIQKILNSETACPKTLNKGSRSTAPTYCLRSLWGLVVNTGLSEQYLVRYYYFWC